MINIIRKHWIIIIVSTIIGLFHIAPNVAVIMNGDNKGMTIIGTDAEYMYLTRINGIRKSCVFNCNPYIKEYGYIYPHFNSTISEIILSIPLIIFDIPVNLLKVVYDFLLPALISLFFYILLFRLTKNSYISILGSIVFLLGGNLFNATDLINIPELLKLIRFETVHNAFLIYSRPINPQFSSLFFIVYLNLLLYFVNKRNIKGYVINGILYGLSFYVYFFVYFFISVIIFLWFLLYIFRKEFRLALYTTLSFVLGLLIAIPQFVQIFSLLGSKYYDSIPEHFLKFTHVPHITLVGVMLFLVSIILVYLYKNKHRIINESAYFVFVLIASCFVTRNEHVISGMIMQYSHFELYQFAPVIIIASAFFVVSLLSESVIRKISLLFPIIVVAVLFNAFLIQYESYSRFKVYLDKEKIRAPLFKWININLPEKSVFAGSRDIMNALTVYTNNYVIWDYFAREWISLPSRDSDFELSRGSIDNLLMMGNRYGVDYYIEEKANNPLSKLKRKVVYEDENFIIFD